MILLRVDYKCNHPKSWIWALVSADFYSFTKHLPESICEHYPAWLRTVTIKLLSSIGVSHLAHQTTLRMWCKYFISYRRSGINTLGWQTGLSTAGAVAIHLRSPPLCGQKQFVVPRQLPWLTLHSSTEPKPDNNWHNGLIRFRVLHVTPPFSFPSIFLSDIKILSSASWYYGMNTNGRDWACSPTYVISKDFHWMLLTYRPVNLLRPLEPPGNFLFDPEKFSLVNVYKNDSYCATIGT